MKHILLLISVAISIPTSSQIAADISVMMHGTLINDSTIRVSWDTDANTTGYSLYRKLVSENSWGTPIAFPAAQDTTYTDITIESGVQYEYRMVKSASTYTGYGYLACGNAIRHPHDRGDLLLLVETSIGSALETEIGLLEDDLRADGWRVHTVFAATTDPVSGVKADIVEAFDTLLALKMIYIIGHVPVPYSGNIAPDGHTDHQGAWPADVYYAEVNDLWSDNSVWNSSASDSRNHNVGGDGKFDQNSLPGVAELMLGRVDFSSLTVFSEDEIELTRRYLNRSHAYKRGEWTLPARALIDDNFGGYAEGFASNGWRNFSPLVGRQNTVSMDYRSTMATDGYLFSYGCGGGSHTSAGGIGTSSDFAGDSLLTGFTMLFGSYFGDWDRQDNFMRSALAQGRTLAISWAGRPHWHYHHMGIGYPVGYSALLSQNNNSLYTFNYGARGVHAALLGDPSLRMSYPAPPTALQVDSVDTFHIALTWTASTDATIDGYFIYRSQDGSPFYLLNETPVTDTTYIDSCVLYAGLYNYVVKAARLENNFSGSFWNESLGLSSALIIKKTKLLSASYSTTSSGGTLFQMSCTSVWATRVKWIFQDTTYFGNSCTVTLPWLPMDTTLPFVLEVENDCSIHSVAGVVKRELPGITESENHRLLVYPNPATAGAAVSIAFGQQIDRLSIFSADGRVLLEISNPEETFLLPGSMSGPCILRIEAGGHSLAEMLIIQ